MSVIIELYFSFKYLRTTVLNMYLTALPLASLVKKEGTVYSLESSLYTYEVSQKSKIQSGLPYPKCVGPN